MRVSALSKAHRRRRCRIRVASHARVAAAVVDTATAADAAATAAAAAAAAAVAATAAATATAAVVIGARILKSALASSAFLLFARAAWFARSPPTLKHQPAASDRVQTEKTTKKNSHTFFVCASLNSDGKIEPSASSGCRQLFDCVRALAAAPSLSCRRRRELQRRAERLRSMFVGRERGRGRERSPACGSRDETSSLSQIDALLALVVRDDACKHAQRPFFVGF